MATIWKCNVTLNLHDSGWLVFWFSSKADMVKVLYKGPYSVQGKPLVLKPMPTFSYFSKPDMSFASIWVHFPNLPLECWSSSCLFKIVKAIGNPLRCDDHTNTMSRLSFSRVMIEVDLSADLIRSINISLPNGTSFEQRVIYEYLPQFCT
jgi:hypothetical protein